MHNTVVIKGNKSGLTVFLDPAPPFEQLLSDVAEKFRESRIQTVILSTEKISRWVTREKIQKPEMAVWEWMSCIWLHWPQS